ncbi:hypothetical protein [Streptomyces sp. NPDC093984]|uniref:hypothetical protein n=1 Tax=Streptomyces sp. NPDC093984 TaxID=3366052 RepID=UPI003801942E
MGLAHTLLMVVALGDAVTMTDLALAAYERALEPKRLQMIQGGHFDPYTSRFRPVERRSPRLVP